jgi:hypothetical protein
MSNFTKWVTCRWNIDFWKLSTEWSLKNTYVLSNYEIYHQNISNFKYEVDLNTILTKLVSNVFSTYFYDTKVIEMYTTSHKLNVGPYGFIFLLQNILSLLSCVHIKNYSIF